MTDGPEPDTLLLFTPVEPRRRRHDGWTAEVQRAFVAALEGTGGVAAACRSVGRSPSSAYALRERAGNDHPFARAWDEALARAGRVVVSRALDRLADPVMEPVFYHGRQVGVRPRNDDGVLSAALTAFARLDRIDQQERIR